MAAETAPPPAPPRRLCNAAYLRSVLIAAAAGVAGVCVPAIGANLAAEVTSDGAAGVYASAVNFLGGLVVSAVGAAAHRPAGFGEIRFRDFKWFNWLGGVFGACYVTGSILMSRELGLALFFILCFAGMLFISIVFDKRGFLVFPKRPVKAVHILAAGIVLAGLVTVQEPHTWGDSGHDDSGANLTVGGRVGYAAAVFLLGFNNPVQAAVNRSTGALCPSPYWSMVLSFLGASVVMVAASCVQMALKGPIEMSGDVQWWHFCGGAFGPIFVGGAIVATPVLGACTFYCILVASQLSTAFLFDAVGALGYAQKDPTAWRVVGALLTLGGVVLYSVMQPAAAPSGNTAPPEDAAAGSPAVAEVEAAAVEMSDVEITCPPPAGKGGPGDGDAASA